MRDAARAAEGAGAQASTHEVAESIPVTPQMYQRLTAKIAGKPEERILSYLMLRSLKQARYSEQNEGHFALASPCYTHFTSPIRRYPDLIVHRLVRDLIRAGADTHGGAILSSDPQPWQQATDSVTNTKVAARRPEPYASEPIPEAELAAIATESSQAERRADDAERELMEWKKMRFMEDRVGDDFHGIILSCTKYGFFVELDDLFIEGLVPIASLSGWGSDERFVFRDTDKQIVSTRSGRAFKMGQRVHVLLDRIDREQRRLQFALVPSSEQTETKSPRKGKAAKAAELAGNASKHASPDRSGKPRKVKAGKTKSKARGTRQEDQRQTQIIPGTIREETQEKTHMAHMVFCTKYKAEMEGLDEPPFDSDFGQKIYKNVSKQAWGEWVERQKMLLNEYRLQPWTREAQEFLVEQMNGFFFGEGEGGSLPKEYVAPTIESVFIGNGLLSSTGRS